MASYKNSILDFLFLVLWVLIGVTALGGPQEIPGNSREYIIQTQGIVASRTLVIDTEARRKQWNETNPYKVQLEPNKAPKRELKEENAAGGGFGELYGDRQLNYRYEHFWGYSFSVAPLYWLLQQFDSSGKMEYLSFRLMNLLFLAYPLFVMWGRGRSWSLLLLTTAFLCSPVVPYIDWAQPHLFCFFLVMMAFLLIDAPRAWWISPLFLGVAAAENLPLALLFPIHFLASHGRGGMTGRGFFMYLVSIVITASSAFYFYRYFGVINVSYALGKIHLEYATLSRVTSFLVSPSIGVIWAFAGVFFPLLLLCKFRNLWLLILLLCFTVATAFVVTASANFYGEQIWCPPYALWIIAPLAWFALTEKSDQSLRDIIAPLLAVPAILWFQTYRLPIKETNMFEHGRRIQPQVAKLYDLTKFDDAPEVIAENITSGELSPSKPFNGIYVWRLSSQSSMWLVSERTLKDLGQFTWRSSLPLNYTSHPQQEVFKEEGDLVSLNGKGITQFFNDPQYGKYLYIWLNDVPSEISSNVPIYIVGE